MDTDPFVFGCAGWALHIPTPWTVHTQRLNHLEFQHHNRALYDFTVIDALSRSSIRATLHISLVAGIENQQDTSSHKVLWLLGPGQLSTLINVNARQWRPSRPNLRLEIRIVNTVVSYHGFLGAVQCFDRFAFDVASVLSLPRHFLPSPSAPGKPPVIRPTTFMLSMLVRSLPMTVLWRHRKSR